LVTFAGPEVFDNGIFPKTSKEIQRVVELTKDIPQKPHERESSVQIEELPSATPSEASSGQKNNREPEL
jgi:hypothetical protein